ncbi:hypothetical protein MPEAHAMD_5968 [Methylobacterium frigidaeris]|uniref:Uncharacterized protein n=2 Tax=Methylobacterium frigidaeris TaxID=2038277 RepID=A0AA37HHA5_9HYPH|nr:hypothetical protein MPEAHAMD_5968 [Methylobacterium frigidaeris]
MKIGNIQVLTRNGERLIQAIAQGSWAQLTPSEFRSYKKSLSDWNEGDVVLPSSPYHHALEMIEAGETSAAAVATALSGDGANGAAGNVWHLFDVAQATRQAERTLQAGDVIPVPRGTKIASDEPTANRDAVYDYTRDPRLQEPLAVAEEDDRSEPEGTPIGAAIRWGVDDPEADRIEPDDVLQDEDTGSISVTADGLAHVAGIGFRTARQWLKRSGLQGPIYDLADIERWLIAQQAAVAKLSRLPKGEVRDALLSIRGWRKALAASRATRKAVNCLAEAQARYGLMKAIAQARDALAEDELDALLAQALRGRAA